jgi:hypothetical protein
MSIEHPFSERFSSLTSDSYIDVLNALTFYIVHVPEDMDLCRSIGRSLVKLLQKYEDFRLEDVTDLLINTEPIGPFRQVEPILDLLDSHENHGEFKQVIISFCYLIMRYLEKRDHLSVREMIDYANEFFYEYQTALDLIYTDAFGCHIMPSLEMRNEDYMLSLRYILREIYNRDSLEYVREQLMTKTRYEDVLNLVSKRIDEITVLPSISGS